MTDSTIRRFEVSALYSALDARRMELGLTWKQVADQLWDLSSDLNHRRRDHPISPSTLTNMAKNPLRTAKFATNIDLALCVSQWIGRPAADFVHPATW